MARATTPPPVHIEVRPGEGGDDAALFATELVQAIRAWARRNNHTTTEPDLSGRTITFSIDRAARPMLNRLAGTHRIQREPRNGGGKRHTSTATIAVLDTPTVTVHIDPADVVEETYRGTGPGGQHRNKTASDVRLTHLPTGTVVTASGRSQWQNRQTAWTELRDRLTATAAEQAAEEVNDQRVGQVRSDRSAKGWTWNDQRDEVTDHRSGQTFRMRRMLAGRF